MSIQQKMTVKQTSEGLTTHNLKQATREHDSVPYMPRYRKCTVSRIHFKEMWNRPSADKVTGEQNLNLLKQPGVSQFASTQH